MNKQQLVDAVGERLGDRKTAAVAVEAVLQTVTGALAEGERVALFGFGVFERVDRAARTARNPSTGGTVEVPATAVPRFRPGQALKDAVNGRSSRTGTGAPSDDGPARSTTAARASAAPAEAATPAEPARASKAGKAEKVEKVEKPRTDKASKAKADKPKAAKAVKPKADSNKSAKPKADSKKKGKGK